MSTSLLEDDRKRSRTIPRFQKYYRLSQKYEEKHILGRIYRILLRFWCKVHIVELSPAVQIDGGLYIGHPNCIIINPKVKIGRNVNIHKGVTIGQENRGKRKGVPTIGDEVWIGVNATIVGGITIGDDVLIAPNTYINCDIPSHSIVLGNPCIIKSGHQEFGVIDYSKLRHRVILVMFHHSR